MFEEQQSHKPKSFKLLLKVLVLFFVFLTVLIGVNIINEMKRTNYIGQEIESQNTISVSATGEVFAKPDLASISFSVTKEAKSVNEAMEQNTEKMNTIIGLIKELGIEEKDLKTTSFNIYPRYEYVNGNQYIYPPTGKRVLAGYVVSQSLQVKIRDMAKIGQVIQTATEAGATEASSLQFSIDQEDELKKQAREQAIEKAKAKAKELASQLGVRLVRITNFQESSAIPRFYALEEAMGKGGGGDIAQIETGENLVAVSVIITYEIN